MAISVENAIFFLYPVFYVSADVIVNNSVMLVGLKN